MTMHHYCGTNDPSIFREQLTARIREYAISEYKKLEMPYPAIANAFFVWALNMHMHFLRTHQVEGTFTLQVGCHNGSVNNGNNSAIIQIGNHHVAENYGCNNIIIQLNDGAELIFRKSGYIVIQISNDQLLEIKQ